MLANCKTDCIRNLANFKHWTLNIEHQILNNWLSYSKGFKAFLQLEKSLSPNSIEAYLHDIEKLQQYLDYAQIKAMP